jgi:hypothetical protein
MLDIFRLLRLLLLNGPGSTPPGSFGDRRVAPGNDRGQRLGRPVPPDFGGFGPGHSVQVEPGSSREIGFHTALRALPQSFTRRLGRLKLGQFISGMAPVLQPSSRALGDGPHGVDRRAGGRPAPTFFRVGLQHLGDRVAPTSPRHSCGSLARSIVTRLRGSRRRDGRGSFVDISTRMLINERQKLRHSAPPN